MAATFNHTLCSTGANFDTSRQHNRSSTSSFLCSTPLHPLTTLSIASSKHNNRLQVFACTSSPLQPQKTNTNSFTSSPKLFVSGLSFRTSEESLRNAFQSFGQLIEVNLVMDKIANRPRGFAFLRYATKEESEKAIEGMHGKEIFTAVVEMIIGSEMDES